MRRVGVEHGRGIVLRRNGRTIHDFGDPWAITGLRFSRGGQIIQVKVTDALGGAFQLLGKTLVGGDERVVAITIVTHGVANCPICLAGSDGL